MGSSSSDWSDAVAHWSRVGELGMEAALREAGASEQTIAETLRSVQKQGHDFWISAVDRLTDPELGRATVLATLGRGISQVQSVSSEWEDWSMNLTEAAALCVNVSSNTNITILRLEETQVFGTVEGCALLGNALAANSSIRWLRLRRVGMRSEGVLSLFYGLQWNKTLHRLDLDGNPLQDEGIKSVAEYLIKNTKIQTLDLTDTQMSPEAARHMCSALANNTSLTTLWLGDEGMGKEAMKRLLEPLSVGVGEAAMNSSSPNNTSLECLYLYRPSQDSVQSLTHMIRINKSLRRLGLWEAHSVNPLLPTDWTQHIIPALKDNESLTQLSLFQCAGLEGNEVFESLLQLVQNSNTGLEGIELDRTGLQSRLGQIDEELRINKEYRTQLNRLRKTPTTFGRIVLCGFGFAGKTEIAKAMQRIEHGTSCAQPRKMSWKKFMQSSPGFRRFLFGKDAQKESSTQTRGFQVFNLQNQPNIKSIWDFAGQKEYYALHDYIFPDVKNSYFLYVCSCRCAPNESNLEEIKEGSRIRDESEFWLRYFASNSKPSQGSQESQRPQVRFVLTKTDTLLSIEAMNEIISIVKEVVRELETAFEGIVDLCADVQVVNAHSSTDVQFLLSTSSQNLERILAHQQEYVVCEEVRNLLEAWSRRNPLKPVLTLSKF